MSDPNTNENPSPCRNPYPALTTGRKSFRPGERADLLRSGFLRRPGRKITAAESRRLPGARASWERKYSGRQDQRWQPSKLITMSAVTPRRAALAFLTQNNSPELDVQLKGGVLGTFRHPLPLPSVDIWS